MRLLSLCFVLLVAVCLAEQFDPAIMRHVVDVHPNCDKFDMDGLWRDVRALARAGTEMLISLRDNKRNEYDPPDGIRRTRAKVKAFETQEAIRRFHRLRNSHMAFGTR